MPILRWDKDQNEILVRLQTQAKLKLCCKTLSEPELVHQWITHHSAIVGPDNLIVADNGSSDAPTLDVYKKYCDTVTIFQFDGSHNAIHWHPRFRPLFERLQKLTQFFAFIDVDERLTWIEGDCWSADRRILDQLTDSQSIYPATWLINAIGSASRFTLLDTERRPILLNNMKWGKPILPSALIGSQAGIHNIQYAGQKFSTDCAGRLFLLHLTQFPNQRIAANVKKLVNRGVVDLGIEPEIIPEMDFGKHPDKTVLRFQDEIAKMIAYLKGDHSISENETEVLELGENGELLFSNEKARAMFRGFVDNSPAEIDRTFG